MEYDFRALYFVNANKKQKDYINIVYNIRDNPLEILPYHLYSTQQEAKERLGKINRELEIYKSDDIKQIYKEEIVFLNNFIKSKSTDIYDFIKITRIGDILCDRIHKYKNLIYFGRNRKDIIRHLTFIITIFPELFSSYKDFEKVSMDKTDDSLKELYIESMRNIGVYHLCELLYFDTHITASYVDTALYKPDIKKKLYIARDFQEYFNENKDYRIFTKSKNIWNAIGYYDERITVRIPYPYTLCDRMTNYSIMKNREILYYEKGEKWYDFFFKKKDVLGILKKLEGSKIPKEFYSDYRIYVKEFAKSKYTYFLDYMVSEEKVINVSPDKHFALKLRGILLHFHHNDTEFQISYTLKEKYFYQFFDVLTAYILYIAVNHYYPKELIDKILIARNLSRELALKGKVDETLVDKIEKILKDNNHEIYNIYDRFKVVSISLEPMKYELDDFYKYRYNNDNFYDLRLNIREDIYTMNELYEGKSPQEVFYMGEITKVYNKRKIELAKQRYIEEKKYNEENKEKIEEERKKYREERNKRAKGNKCTNLTDLSLEDIRHDQKGIYIVEENGKKYCYTEKDLEGLNMLQKMPWTNMPISGSNIGNRIKDCKGKKIVFSNGKIKC